MSDRIICYCLGVRENSIVQAIQEGAHTLKAVQELTKAATGNRCSELNPQGHCCSSDIIAIIKRETGTEPKADCRCCE
jgi:bacterioferritin-associated ferredoxin